MFLCVNVVIKTNLPSTSGTGGNPRYHPVSCL